MNHIEHFEHIYRIDSVFAVTIDFGFYCEVDIMTDIFDALVAEDDIPIPPEPESKRRSPYTDAVAALAPGQSVLIPRPLQTGLSAALWATARAGLAPGDAKLRYSVRAVEGGCRVWRNKRPEGYQPPLDPPREDA